MLIEVEVEELVLLVEVVKGTVVVVLVELLVDSEVLLVELD